MSAVRFWAPTSMRHRAHQRTQHFSAMYCLSEGTRWPKGFACNNGLLHSKDLIPAVLMVAAAHTPCQGGRFA